MRLTDYMTTALHIALPTLALVGCGVDASDVSPAALRIEPADVTQVVVDGQPVSTQYRAYLVQGDGFEQDVTAETMFELSRPELGTWHAVNGDTSLELNGAAVGPAAVNAKYRDLSAAAGIEVHAQTSIVDDDAALANAVARFDAARTDYSCFPLVMYPEQGTILPPNLDGLDVQWTDYVNDLFKVSFKTRYATVDLYTTNMEHALSADAWAQLASTNEAVMMGVSSISGGSPSVACTAQDRRLLVADQPLTGAVYSWSDGEGIWRHDVATRGEPEPLTILPPDALVTQTTTQYPVLASTCAGCAVSQNGERIALRLDTGDGAIIDFTQQTMLQPTAWESATFTPRANKLVIAEAGQLSLIDDAGDRLATIENTPGWSALDPQFSPDGTRLVSVESTPLSSTGSANLVIRTYDNDGNVFGEPTELFPCQAGVANYAPSWSPDGKWIAFTRTIGWGTSFPTTSIWIVKADGSQPPLQFVSPTADVDMTARWAPAVYSVSGEKFYYLTFDSIRPYGTHDVARQIWMMAFFPKSQLGRPAFHVPFQSLDSSNHISQWSQTLVR
jgi:TolB protein